MATAKKKFLPTTEVKVINNAIGSSSFFKVDGRLARFPAQGSFQMVLIEDLQLLILEAPAMLEEGIIIIPEKEAREFLGINTDNIIIHSKIAKLLKETPEVMQEKISKTSTSNKRDIAAEAKKVSDTLTGSQVKVIEQETKIKITDDF